MSKSPHVLMSEYYANNPEASAYEIAAFAKANNIEYSSGGGSIGSQEDSDSGKMVYSSEEWSTLTEESTPEIEKEAGNDSF